MSPTRLIVRGQTIAPGDLLVPETAAHHARVTRVAAGDEIELLNLAGLVGVGTLVAWEARGCVVRVEEIVRNRGEAPAPLVLALAQLHTDAFTWAVEKATELGATAIVPVTCERVQGRRHGDRTDRWQRVADAAVAQCGRSRTPQIEAASSLSDLLGGAPGVRLVADPRAAQTPAISAGGSGLTVLIGPEGGFTEDERRAIALAGFTGLRLGSRTLRAETAAIASLTLAQHLAGWL